ncbi:hypothetical protein EZ313_06470 [Ramlibacter henchirensis]|uniref:NHL repeat containing protein n=1 Tax=Ramlibacter henchirensis TaxID=204072 RepID=A0A4Z0C5P0_9BURK|nr:hypothetical protein [Ramlibacter henchirensis]TFZ06284.1 hypothetical protein EZ313_06470 [Ramlibacter henchirensis]
MLLRPTSLRARRAWIAFTFATVFLSACGGSGGDTVAGPGPAPSPPALPIDPPALPPPVAPPPGVRGPITYQAAHLVLGQADASGGAANRGGSPSAQTLFFPGGMAITPDGGFLVADTNNNRILFFDQVPTESGHAAVGILGQDTPQGSSPSVSLTGLNRPLGIAIGAGKMAVADKDARRVLIYDARFAPGAMPLPQVVIGQVNFDQFVGSCSVSEERAGMRAPDSVWITPQGKLIVSDPANNRVLIWDAVPTTQAEAASPRLVIGQFDMAHCAENDDNHNHVPDTINGERVATARTLSEPAGVWSDDRLLVIADRRNNRVLIWTDFPQDNFEEADIVLGHDSFSNTAYNSEIDADGSSFTPTAKTLFSPTGVHSDGTSLAVVDRSNNRVLIWNEFPSRSGQQADVILGHADAGAAVTNDSNGDRVTDVPTAQVLNFPRQVLLTPTAVYVSDRAHNRVLVFRR